MKILEDNSICEIHLAKDEDLEYITKEFWKINGVHINIKSYFHFENDDISKSINEILNDSDINIIVKSFIEKDFYILDSDFFNKVKSMSTLDKEIILTKLNTLEILDKKYTIIKERFIERYIESEYMIPNRK